MKNEPKRTGSVCILMIALLVATTLVVAAAPPPGEAYIVQPGDWLAMLAERFYGDVTAWTVIVEATNEKASQDGSFAFIDDPTAIEVGQKLWIPEATARPAMSATAGSPFSGSAGERNTALYLESIRDRPPLLYNFLSRLPKGGELHTHLSGSIYAESYVEWAAADGLCVDEKMSAVDGSCDKEGLRPIADALSHTGLYSSLIDAWSMRDWGLSGKSGHDQFFDTFGEYGGAKEGRADEMMAEYLRVARAEAVSYVEVMLTLTGDKPREIMGQVGWKDDLAAMRQAVLDKGLVDELASSYTWLDELEAGYRAILRCDTDQAEPACNVTVRYIHQVLRLRAPQDVFVEMLAGFEMASADPRVVSLNLVAPEDNLVSRRDYSRHMAMAGYLNEVYPEVHLTFHAGELTLGLVPPPDLRFHIREAVERAGVRRIGHGVDLMYEDNAFALLETMAENKVLVEVCLSSNDLILGVRGADHPLSVYIEYGVPVVLATDDAGISRSTMANEYKKAVTEQGLGYLQLKTMARSSLEYAFVQGESLWAKFDALAPVPACATDLPGSASLSATCRGYLDQNERARLQWNLERAFWDFESGGCCSD